MPALHRATREGHLNLVQLLVEAGASIDRKIAPMSLSPLLIAVNRGLLDIAIYLISKGADINAENSIGWNALRIAVESRNVPMASMLLDKKARVRDAGQMYESAKEDLMKELVFNAALQAKGNVIASIYIKHILTHINILPNLSPTKYLTLSINIPLN